MYDEFGNYIGPDLNVDDEDDNSSDSGRKGRADSSDSDEESSRGVSYYCERKSHNNGFQL